MASDCPDEPAQMSPDLGALGRLAGRSMAVMKRPSPSNTTMGGGGGRGEEGGGGGGGGGGAEGRGGEGGRGGGGEEGGRERRGGGRGRGRGGGGGGGGGRGGGEGEGGGKEGGRQEGGGGGLEAVFVIVGIEQAQLLIAVNGIEGIIDVEHDLLGSLSERGAVQLDQGPSHAHQTASIGHVLQARECRLRGEIAIGWKDVLRHLEDRVGAQVQKAGQTESATGNGSLATLTVLIGDQNTLAQIGGIGLRAWLASCAIADQRTARCFGFTSARNPL